MQKNSKSVAALLFGDFGTEGPGEHGVSAVLSPDQKLDALVMVSPELA